MHNCLRCRWPIVKTAVRADSIVLSKSYEIPETHWFIEQLLDNMAGLDFGCDDSLWIYTPFNFHLNSKFEIRNKF